VKHESGAVVRHSAAFGTDERRRATTPVVILGLTHRSFHSFRRMPLSDSAIEPSPDRVLVVEDDPQIARLLMRLLTSNGFVVDVVNDGSAALDAIALRQPTVILLDWMLPGKTGVEVCQILKREPATRLIPIVLITGLNARTHRLEGINAGADDFLTKPFDSEELLARVRSLARLKRYTDELDSAESVITSLALTVEARDEYTDGHCQRLAKQGVALGQLVGAGKDELAALVRGGFLHDVGKIGIPDSILLKHGTLTGAEYGVMKQHTTIGEKLCGSLRSLAAVRPIVRHHHERLDGSGYPDGLQGDEIPFLAQIIGVVDAFDAMTTSRPYRAAMPLDRACDELRESARRGKFNRELVEVYLGLVDDRPAADRPVDDRPVDGRPVDERGGAPA
jgi:putative two-component system response regulator